MLNGHWRKLLKVFKLRQGSFNFKNFYDITRVPGRRDEEMQSSSNHFLYLYSLTQKQATEWDAIPWGCLFSYKREFWLQKFISVLPSKHRLFLRPIKKRTSVFSVVSTYVWEPLSFTFGCLSICMHRTQKPNTATSICFQMRWRVPFSLVELDFKFIY